MPFFGGGFESCVIRSGIAEQDGNFQIGGKNIWVDLVSTQAK